ncbi:MAG TPA: PAS domain S-box protein [Verrucomicrobiae bacterium]|jgi:PAS domain S-box-containing protein
MLNRTSSILIVDDDDRVRELFATCLRMKGYDVQVAATGWQGLELAKKYVPDLILLDVKLPDISGMEVCRQVKGDPALADVFVAFCTGEATGVASKVDGLEIGADEYLIKPFGLAELAARVRTLLRLRDTTAALRASEDHYRRLIDILPDAICLISPQGQLISVNSQAVAMLGYNSPNELLNKSVFDLIPTNERTKVEISILKNRIVRNVEFTLLKKAGESIQVELSATVTLDKDGGTAGVVCVARDITERKQSEKILRDSEERFRQLADNIREVFWMSDVQKTKVIYVSPAYEQVWGRRAEQLLASPGDWIDAIHPEDRERIVEAALTKQTSGQYDEVYRVVRPDQSIRWVQDRAFPIQDESGNVYRLVGIAEDITERKHVLDALRENEARKSAIMRVALDAIITINQAGKIIELNPAAESIFTHNRVKLIGENIMEIVPPSLRAWFRDGLANCFSGEKGPAVGSRIEMPVLRADNSRFFAEFTITRIKLKGEPTFTIYIRDITQRKRAEEELRFLPRRIIKAQELERSRVARELHDGVNQIIASVKMRLRQMHERLPPVQAASKEILMRCDKLLTDAVEENRRIAHNLHPVDLDNLGFSEACRHLCKEFQSRTSLKVRCRITLPDDIRLAPNIHLSLFRIVQEAINNIEKYANAKNVKLQIGHQNESIMLSIQDDGCGFATEKIKASKRQAGHGLGLTNMRERALSLGGSCSIISQPKKGVTILIQIPCKGAI